ncbi:hypothetical protein FA95DRAFT_1267805 [Auriscalpium vulgare]|uniref:Uncharacterized protein n=1 Tax=Auriscalpium vulgare TaxID=40419 RepID=A0ACB8RT76_9AGAM|nr:hypothetical protein FA95DRAFT_1267805 [Auriscalpium vulgare]
MGDESVSISSTPTSSPGWAAVVAATSCIVAAVVAIRIRVAGVCRNVAIVVATAWSTSIRDPSTSPFVLVSKPASASISSTAFPANPGGVSLSTDSAVGLDAATVKVGLGGRAALAPTGTKLAISAFNVSAALRLAIRIAARLATTSRFDPASACVAAVPLRTASSSLTPPRPMESALAAKLVDRRLAIGSAVNCKLAEGPDVATPKVLVSTLRRLALFCC